MNERSNTNIEDNLSILKNALHTAAHKPEHFWRRQRAEILSRMHRPVRKPRHRMAFAWACALIIVLVAAGLFLDRDKMPTASFAAGSDHELLIEVERAVNQDYPEALAATVVANDKPINTGIRFTEISRQ